MTNIKPISGTEILAESLFKRLPNSIKKEINIIIGNANIKSIDCDKKNILWNHHNIDQPAISNIGSQEFLEKISKIIFVSHWQAEKYLMAYKSIPTSKVMVLKNAIEPIPLTTKPRKIKLIYTSTPWRGLDVLLDAFEMISRSDVELDIYSSTIIYGEDFDRSNSKHFNPLFERAKSMKGVNYMGYAKNKQVRESLMNSHILAYPSTWQETSCLSAIEAAMAGCSIITTNFGALPETLSDWATFVQIENDRSRLVEQFGSALDKAIDSFWTAEVQDKLNLQHHHYKKFWSWDYRIKEWLDFLNNPESGSSDGVIHRQYPTS